MTSKRAAILKFTLRWGIAVVGITWIVMQLTIRDRVNVVLADGTVRSVALREPATEDSSQFLIEGQTEPVARADVVSQPDRKTVVLADSKAEVKLLGLHLRGDLNRSPEVDQLVVANPNGNGGIRVRPDEIAGGFTVRTPRPVVEKGLATMGREANPWLLALAIAIFPVTMLLTSLRWNEILRSQDIHLPFKRVFVLNMVGNFYNSFFPGSTGGDFLKAYYVGRQTSHKIRAMLSVFVDRVIGLLALVILGGTMATYGFFSATDAATRANVNLFELFMDGKGPLNPTARACLQVVLGCIVICLGSIVAGGIIASSRIRTALGFDKLVSKLPMQHHLDKVRESGRLYKRRLPWFAVWIALTFPIHITVVISAIIAGRAFGLDIAWPFYFVCVPVMVLVAALPLSPQGAGVMEWFGFLLLAKQGATVSEVLALTLSIRFVQIFWNLIGGLFTLGGHYAAPTAGYDAIADEDTESGSPDGSLDKGTPAPAPV
jgi:hypothetical protein